MSDALALLRETVPERIWRFTEAMLADKDMDPRAAAIAAGAPGQQRAIMEDRRFLVLFSALQNDLRTTHNTLRHQLVASLGRVATFDPADAFEADGVTMRAIKDMPVEVRMALEFTSRPDGSVTIKLSSKTRLEAHKILFALFGDLDAPIAAGGYAKVIFRGRDEET